MRLMQKLSAFLTGALEMVPDDWGEVYHGLCRETVKIVRGRGLPEGAARLAVAGLVLAEAAVESSGSGSEVLLK